MIDIPNDALTMDLYYAVNDFPETPIPDVNEETPVFRNIYISNVLCRGAGRAVYFNGLPEMPLKNIFIKNMTVTNAKKGIVINQASQVNMENIKVEDPEAPGIQIKNATGIIINGKEYKKDSGKMAAFRKSAELTDSELLLTYWNIGINKYPASQNLLCL